MGTMELTAGQWDAFTQADLAVADCYGDHCVACVMLAPVFDALADEMPGVAFGRINISNAPEIGERYGIEAIPTVLFFRRGEKVHEAVGSMSREELLTEMAKLLYQ